MLLLLRWMICDERMVDDGVDDGGNGGDKNCERLTTFGRFLLRDCSGVNPQS